MTMTDQQILRVIYQWGCEAQKSTIENDLQIELGNELVALKAQGLIHLNSGSVALTPKGITTVETSNLVSVEMMSNSSRAREMVRKALKSVLEHDNVGYNSTMAEARKTFTPRYIAAVERYYALNLH
ncbi:MAG TPA: hypothetical protein VGK19_02620 [Capsulimonadaceae bacterium]|jgi:hypothetical protein